MLSRIKQMLMPPIFSDDEEKNNRARLLNSVGLYFALVLIIAVAIYIPFFAKYKLESFEIILLLFVLYVISRIIMFKGYIAFSGIFMIASSWFVCEGVVVISGGIASPMMFAIVSIIIAAELLFHSRIGMVFLILSILLGFGFASIQQSSMNLPTILSYSPMAIWFYFALSLIFVSRIMNLTLRKLEEALALAKAQSKALEETEAILSEREQYNKILFTSSRTPIVVMDKENYRFIDCNPAAIKIYQCNSREEVIGKTPLDFSASFQSDGEASSVKVSLYIDECIQKGEVIFEWLHQHPGGEIWDAEVHLMSFKIQGKELMQFSLRDITRRKRSEEKILAALEEKEILLREVHHRVKNNLQVIIALIEMRIELIHDFDTQIFLKELKEQARTMSLVYEQLYQSENLSRIDMSQYLWQLTTNLLDTFGHRETIKMHVDVSNFLDVSKAMPCGLIVNELFTNILKYAFPLHFKEEKIVSIALRQDGKAFSLTISDNGVGLPVGYDWKTGKTMGLRLVNLWATHQLGGTLDVSNEKGAKFVIRFNLKG